MKDSAHSPIIRFKNVARSFWKHENSKLLIVLFALIAVIGGMTKGLTLRHANVVNVLIQSSAVGITAMGQAMVILTAGIDLSVGGLGLFTSLLASRLMTTEAHLSLLGYSLPMHVVIPLTLLTGLGIGAFNANLIARVSMPPLIVTLGMWEIMKGAGFAVSEGLSLSHLPDRFAFLGQGEIAGVPTQGVVFIAIAILTYLILNYTTYGRSIYAVGGSPVSAWLSGIPVKRIIFSVYVISAFLATLSGLVICSRTMSASLRAMGGFELDTIAAVVIGGVSLMGGRGSILGVILGVLIISIVNNGMSVLGADPAFYGMVKGAIIIAAVGVDYVRRK